MLHSHFSGTLVANILIRVVVQSASSTRPRSSVLLDASNVKQPDARTPAIASATTVSQEPLDTERTFQTLPPGLTFTNDHTGPSYSGLTVFTVVLICAIILVALGWWAYEFLSEWRSDVHDANELNYAELNDTDDNDSEFDGPYFDSPVATEECQSSPFTDQQLRSAFSEPVTCSSPPRCR